MSAGEREHARIAIAALGLPEGLAELLASGLPAELRLGEWRGPTLFSSELEQGGFPRLSAFLRLEDPADDPIVIGTVRETVPDDEEEGALCCAAFCLVTPGHRVDLVDLESRERRFVNIGPSELVRCLTLFEREWAAFRKLGADEIDNFLSWLRGAMKGIDRRCFERKDAYWSAWFAVLEEQKERRGK